MLKGDRYSFTKKNIAKTKDSPAVYQLEGKSTGDILYIGSGDLQTRLTRHLPGKSEPIPASAYHREYTSSTGQARDAEKKCLDAYMRKRGKLPPYNERVG